MHACMYACLFGRVLPGAKILLPSNAPLSKYRRSDGTMSMCAVVNAWAGSCSKNNNGWFIGIPHGCTLPGVRTRLLHCSQLEFIANPCVRFWPYSKHFFLSTQADVKITTHDGSQKRCGPAASQQKMWPSITFPHSCVLAKRNALDVKRELRRRGAQARKTEP